MIQALQTECRDCNMRYRALQTEHKQVVNDYQNIKAKQRSIKEQSERKLKTQKQKLDRIQKEFEALKFKDKHWHAELRAREQEITKLRKRYNERLIAHEKTQRVSLGMRVPMNKQSQRSRRAPPKEVLKIQQQYQAATDCLDQLKEQLNDVVKENSSLRESLMNIQMEIKDNLNENQNIDDDDFEQETQMIAEQFEMPFDVVRTNFEGDMMSDINRIKQRLSEKDQQELLDRPESSLEKSSSNK
eukprot:UN23994